MVQHRLFSFIRTITVGTGITPVLLTLPVKALAGLLLSNSSPPVGNFTPPREFQSSLSVKYNTLSNDMSQFRCQKNASQQSSGQCKKKDTPGPRSSRSAFLQGSVYMRSWSSAVPGNFASLRLILQPNINRDVPRLIFLNKQLRICHFIFHY